LVEEAVEGVVVGYYVVAYYVAEDEKRFVVVLDAQEDVVVVLVLAVVPLNGLVVGFVVEELFFVGFVEAGYSEAPTDHFVVLGVVVDFFFGFGPGFG